MKMSGIRVLRDNGMMKLHLLSVDVWIFGSLVSVVAFSLS